MHGKHALLRLGLATSLLLLLAGRSRAQDTLLLLGRPEQRQIQVADPASLPRARIPASTPPRTVTDPQPGTEVLQMSLDDALRIALANSEVVRVLAGVGAVSSGRTIYDASMTNTTIDRERARFDPIAQAQNNWSKVENPQGVFDPNNPGRSMIIGPTVENYGLNAGVSKQVATGGQIGAGVTNDTTRVRGAVVPLNPQSRHATELNATQPLLQGAGIRVNRAPIVLARIDTDRSYFQYKDSMQELVRGVIQAYWNLVFARTDAWSRKQQVEQSQFAVERAEARRQAGFADLGDVSQTRVALARFRAQRVVADARVLDAEAVLRNLLGLPPGDMRQLVPVSPPFDQRVTPDWNPILELAEQRRPDIIELKLILEADQQRLLLARNNMLPQADAVALYRWNGLEGRMPNGQEIGTNGDAYTDWTLGVNFSVPLYLRQGRAEVRRQELLITRDRANLQQGMHAAVHSLATNLRSQASSYEQYLAFRETRVAARLNLEQQFEEYRSGRTIFLNVLQAIADWGNAVSAEALSLTDYNTSLANLEKETGTILETHGIRFLEERLAAVGPIGLPALYPHSQPATPNAPRYPQRTDAAENAFNLENPLAPRNQTPQPPAAPRPTEELPRPVEMRFLGRP